MEKVHHKVDYTPGGATQNSMRIVSVRNFSQLRLTKSIKT